MCCFVVAALVAVLATCAHAGEQSQAKALEDRWPQCSQVVKGRLGAFHPFNTAAGADWIPKCANTAAFEGYTDAKVAYAPCNTEGSSYLTITANTWDTIGRQTAATFDLAMPVDERLVSYHMPVQKGDQPNFQGNYVGTYAPANGATTSRATAFVQTVCDSSLAEELVMINSINVTETPGDYKYHFDVRLASYHACPLFPYTNAVPPGGVVALFIVIVCFVLEFAACAWYHKTQKVDENPFTATADNEAVNYATVAPSSAMSSPTNHNAAAPASPLPPTPVPPQATSAPRPPAPPTPATPPPSGPPPTNAVERVHGAESASLMDVKLKPAVRLKASYKPPAPLDKCMLDAKSALPKVSEMEFIVEQCTAIAADRRKQNGNELEVDHAMAIALYTFDLGTMGDCPMGSDNFYYVLNEIFRSRDQQALFALQPFLYNFKMAWNNLPNITGTFYRGIPKSALSLVSSMYGAGREVYWSSITSLSVERDIAEKFAAKEGPGGVLMEVAVVDSRSISRYSAIPREGEVILEPNTRLIVTQPVTPAGGINILKLMQVKQEKAFVF